MRRRRTESSKPFYKFILCGQGKGPVGSNGRPRLRGRGLFLKQVRERPWSMRPGCDARSAQLAEACRNLHGRG